MIHQDAVGAAGNVVPLQAGRGVVVAGHHLGAGTHRHGHGVEEHRRLSRGHLFRQRDVRREESPADVAFVHQRPGDETQLHGAAVSIDPSGSPAIRHEVLEGAAPGLLEEALLREHLIEVYLEGGPDFWVDVYVPPRRQGFQE